MYNSENIALTLNYKKTATLKRLTNNSRRKYPLKNNDLLNIFTM